MKLTLEWPIDVIVERADGVEELHVTFRDMTAKERAAHAEKSRQITQLIRDAQRLSAASEILQQRKSVASPEELPALLDREEDLIAKLDAVTERIEAAESELEEVAKERFDLCVSGPDADRLREVAEAVGYRTVVTSLQEEAARLSGKQQPA